MSSGPRSFGGGGGGYWVPARLMTFPDMLLVDMVDMVPGSCLRLKRSLVEGAPPMVSVRAVRRGPGALLFMLSKRDNKESARGLWCT